MTLDQVKASYNQTIDTESKKLSALKKQIFRIGTIRLLLVVACIAICYLMWGNTAIMGACIALTIVSFLALMKYHNLLFIKKTYYELLVLNAKNELKGLDYDFSAFDGASEKADGNHSYSLDLDIFGNRSFFQSINRTVTTFGKDKLVDTILFPFKKKAEILIHQEAIKVLSSKYKLLNHFRAKGSMTEAKEFDYNSFIQQFKQSPLNKGIWKAMTFVTPILSLIIGVLCGFGIIPVSALMIFWVIMLLFSLIRSKAVKNKLDVLDKKIETLKIYSDLFNIIETESFDAQLLKEIQTEVKTPQSAFLAIKQLQYLTRNLDQSFNVVGILLLNPFLFWNVRYSIKIEKWIDRHEESLQAWFDSIAQFDSLVSLSVFAYNHPDYNYPEVSETFAFEGKNLGHPMLNRDVCVRNDVNIAKNPFFLVVTGANMAGKSTYLRTVGINMILASIGAPVCATSLRFYPFQLVTNLRTSDSLNDNESYFFAELKRLKMIIDRLQSGEELFIILDEILKGTNSEDKQKGSIALVKQLVSLNTNGIIATHDLELGNLEKEFPNSVKNYRFEADIKDEHLRFSYKIREGIAQNMNACFLMKKMGITGL